MRTCLQLLALAACAATVDAGVLLARPPQPARVRAHTPLAMVIPGDSLAEVIVVDGGVQFLSLYMGVLTLRILLSWFPQAQGVALLRPIFTASDVYLKCGGASNPEHVAEPRPPPWPQPS